jgi:predicted RNA-binding protein
VASEFAVSIGGEVANDDVVFVGHQDEEILTVTVKIA